MPKAPVPSELKVAELRQELSQRGLSTKGVKKVLVERLTEALENLNTSSATDNDDGDRADDGNSEDQIELLPEDEQAGDNTVSELHVEKEAAERGEDTTNAGVNLDSAMGQANDMEVDNETDAKAEERIGTDTAEEDTHRKRKLSDSVAEVAPAAAQADTETSRSPEATESTHEAIHATAAEDEDEDERSMSASATDSLYIKNLERPLTVFKMRELVEKYGVANDIWLNSIKTRAYVNFDSKETAAAAFDGINGTRFPPEHGKMLECGLITHKRMKELVDTEVSMIEAVHNMDLIAVPAGSGNCGVELVNTKGRGAAKRLKAEKAAGTKAGDKKQAEKAAGGQTASLVVAATSAAANEAKHTAKARRSDEQSREQARGEEKGDSMTTIEADALTRRTKAQPAITFRPLTDEQVAAKRAAAAAAARL
ncbi:hypothetical protein H4R20_005166 [Coemansia guatemalensis]|uniref:SAP domain-containing protein n=1 Tax=Coemansia guatemalensis TaxID=2761395 RepID=A0A9W8HQT8_9FUNG|nr:hypothetical protein H4R20_005166 [Coemansia guatemalensis]